MFCPHCGNAVDSLPGTAVVEEREPVEVVLARIDADRAIQVARIEASARRAEATSAETIAETEADGQVDAAEAVAEIITAAGDDQADEPVPDPIDIIAPTAIAEDEHENAPPEPEGSPVPVAEKKSSFGMW